MEMISGLKKRDDNDDMLEKVFTNGLGQIEDYVEDEDVDTDDLASSDSDFNSSDDEDLVPLPEELSYIKLVPKPVEKVAGARTNDKKKNVSNVLS